MRNRTTIQQVQKPQEKGEQGKRYTWYIGIDTGVNTGLCIWNSEGKFIRYLATLPIHKAMEEVKDHVLYDNNVMVRVEDARLAKYGRRSLDNMSRIKGAGSICRDGKIWEDFLTDLKASYEIDFEMVKPNMYATKMDAVLFRKLTGWEGKSNSHMRDACLIVWGL